MICILTIILILFIAQDAIGPVFMTLEMLLHLVIQAIVRALPIGQGRHA